MREKKLDKILILGKSKKFIKEVKKNLKFKKLVIIPWRNIKDHYSKDLKYDLIFVCGFDFKLFHKNFNLFSKKNIYEPLNLIKSVSKKNSKIIYINTQKMNRKNFTFSRYNFAKQKLAYLIKKSYKNVLIIEADLITVRNKISINSGLISKYIFYLLATFNYIKTVKIEELIKMSFFRKVRSNNKYKNIKGYFLNIPRNQFIDRSLRLLFG